MLKKILLTLPVVSLLMACDNISEQDRFIDTGEIHAARKVLLTEFTGQRCTNCPDAHKIIESLEEQYGDDLIVVSIHAGTFGISVDNGGLMQEEGNEYAEHYNISAYPAGVVDDSGEVLTMNLWATAIREDIVKPTSLELSIEAQVSSDKKNIEVFTTMVSPDYQDGNLLLWVVENDIVAFQIYGSDRLQDYVHNNVFRACVNGLWGENIPVDKNVVKYASNTVEINPDWNLDNVYIVGYYYDSNGVVEADKCSVKQ